MPGSSKVLAGRTWWALTRPRRMNDDRPSGSAEPISGAWLMCRSRLEVEDLRTRHADRSSSGLKRPATRTAEPGYGR